MGTFCRSKDELILVFKQGTAEHTNAFGLRDTGKHRSNVCNYAGGRLINPTRMDEPDGNGVQFTQVNCGFADLTIR